MNPARMVTVPLNSYYHSSSHPIFLFTTHYDAIYGSIPLLVKYYSDYYECPILKNMQYFEFLEIYYTIQLLEKYI